MRITKTKRSFKKELKRQVKYAIAAAVGFVIAFSWKEAIWNSAASIIERFVDETKTTINNLSTAIFISIIGVLIILISVRLLRD